MPDKYGFRYGFYARDPDTNRLWWVCDGWYNGSDEEYKDILETHTPTSGLIGPNNWRHVTDQYDMYLVIERAPPSGLSSEGDIILFHWEQDKWTLSC